MSGPRSPPASPAALPKARGTDAAAAAPPALLVGGDRRRRRAESLAAGSSERRRPSRRKPNATLPPASHQSRVGGAPPRPSAPGLWGALAGARRVVGEERRRRRRRLYRPCTSRRTAGPRSVPRRTGRLSRMGARVLAPWLGPARGASGVEAGVERRRGVGEGRTRAGTPARSAERAPLEPD